jgi:hypothetical protein
VHQQQSVDLMPYRDELLLHYVLILQLRIFFVEYLFQGLPFPLEYQPLYNVPYSFLDSHFDSPGLFVIPHPYHESHFVPLNQPPSLVAVRNFGQPQ